MKKTTRSFIFCSLLLMAGMVHAQTLQEADSTEESAAVGTFSIKGYVDVYYGYDFSRPAERNRPYFVSSNRHNEFTVNLAYIDVQYDAERVRARFVPGIGTYLAANYAAEQPMFRNLVEGYVGVKLLKNQDVWLDVGVLGSPYTNESAISFDQLMYTRSFAPEYVPYYLAGARLALPLSKKWTTYLYLLNGWQNIQETNTAKSLGTQVEYRPLENLLINWNTYIGNEQNQDIPSDMNRMRYFSDIYILYNIDGKFSGTTCAYLGAQRRNTDNNGRGANETSYWHQVNLTGRYRFNPRFSLSGRLEYFQDPGGVQIIPITLQESFASYSTSLCANYAYTSHVLIRLESRTFFSDRSVYLSGSGLPVNTSQLLMGSMAIKF